MFTPVRTKYIEGNTFGNSVHTPTTPKKVRSVFQAFSESQREDLGISFKTQVSPIKSQNQSFGVEKHHSDGDETQISIQKTLDKIGSVFNGNYQKNDESPVETEDELDELGETFAIIRKLRQTKLNKTNHDEPIEDDKESLFTHAPSDRMDDIMGEYNSGYESPFLEEPIEMKHKEVKQAKKIATQKHKKTPEKKKILKSEVKREVKKKTPALKRVLSFNDSSHPTKESKLDGDFCKTIKFEDTLYEESCTMPLIETPTCFIDARIKIVNINDFECDFLQSIEQKIVKRENAQIVATIRSEDNVRKNTLVKASLPIVETKSGRRVKPPGEFWLNQ
jgi:hypothetical protein